MKPLPLIVSLGLVGSVLLTGSSLVIARESRPLPRPTTNSPESESQPGSVPGSEGGEPGVMTERPTRRPLGRDEGDVLILPEGEAPEEATTGEGMPISVKESRPSSSKVTQETLDARRDRIQEMKEQRRLNTCEIYQMQLESIGDARARQNERVSNRYRIITNRLSEIIEWLATQEVDVADLEQKIEVLQEEQDKYIASLTAYTQEVQSVRCSGGEALNESDRAELANLRTSARELAQTNAELRRVIREDILAQLRTLNL